MEYLVRVDGREIAVRLGSDSVSVDDAPWDIELAPKSESPVRAARVGVRPLRVVPRRVGHKDWTLQLEGVTYRAKLIDPMGEPIGARTSTRIDQGPAPLRAPMPGLILEVGVSSGDLVERGDGVMVMEAMKMENELKVERRARVAGVRVNKGDTVEKGQILLEFEVVETSE